MAENNQANAPAQEQDLSEILKVRRESWRRCAPRDAIPSSRRALTSATTRRISRTILTSSRAPRSPSDTD